MKKYFYNDGANSFGPFTIEELRELNITRETLVWFQELGSWKSAGEVSELADLFKLVPPPLLDPDSKFDSTETLVNQKPPKSWMVESILVTLFCCLPFGIAGLVNASKVESQYYAGDVAGAKRSSEKAEEWVMLSLWIGFGIGVVYFLALIIS